MNTKISITFLILTAVLLLSPASHARQKVTTTTTEVATGSISMSADRITDITNQTPCPITVSTGKPQVRISGNRKALDALDVTIYGSKVNITVKKHTGNVNLSKVKIRIFTDELSSVNILGSGSLTADKADATSCRLQVMGSGSITIKELDSTGLTLLNAGTGNINIHRADCTSFRATSQGTGDITVDRLDCTGVDVSLLGTGNISLPAADGTTMRVINQGTGDVRVSGDFTSVTLNLQGTGDIIATGINATRVTRIQQGTGRIRE